MGTRARVPRYKLAKLVDILGASDDEEDEDEKDFFDIPAVHATCAAHARPSRQAFMRGHARVRRRVARMMWTR